MLDRGGTVGHKHGSTRNGSHAWHVVLPSNLVQGKADRWGRLWTTTCGKWGGSWNVCTRHYQGIGEMSGPEKDMVMIPSKEGNDVALSACVIGRPSKNLVDYDRDCRCRRSMGHCTITRVETAEGGRWRSQASCHEHAVVFSPGPMVGHGFTSVFWFGARDARLGGKWRRRSLLGPCKLSIIMCALTRGLCFEIIHCFKGDVSLCVRW